MKKRKVLIIIPSLGGGGAEKILVNLLNQIDLNSFEIDLFVGKKGGVYRAEIPKMIQVRTLFKSNLLSRIITLSYIFFGSKIGISWIGRKITGSYDFGLSFMDSVYSDFLFHNKAKIKRRGTVIHSSYLSYSKKGNYRKGKHFTRLENRYSSMNTIVFVSNESKLEFEKLFGSYNDMKIIYNPINKSAILEKSKKPLGRLTANKIHLIAIGRIIEVKGYDLLIEACKVLDDKNIDFELRILGEGNLKDKLRLMISELGLSEKIFIHNFEKNPYNWLKNSDIFIMSSIAEGLPTSLCEAIILEKPVIVPNVPGCREVIDYGKYGVMVDRNVSDFSQGLENLITNSELRQYYSELAKKRSEIFDDKIAVDKYTQIFNK